MRYTYRCTNEGCTHHHLQFVVSHSIKEDPVIECGECAESCSRVITGGGGVVFKGMGFTTKDARYRRAMEGEPLRPNAKSQRRYTSIAGIEPGKSKARSD